MSPAQHIDRPRRGGFGEGGILVLMTWILSGCVQHGPARSRTNIPQGQAAQVQGSQSGPGKGSKASAKPRPSAGQAGSSRSVEKQRFLTLEEEPLLAESMRGLKAVWIFWPGTGEDQLHHMQVRAFRQRLDRLLGSRGDLVVLEFHHHHLSSQTAPRRDRSRHEHLWDPQAITALRLNVPKLPAAVVVTPELTVFDAFTAPKGGLADFYLKIIQSLASLDAASPPDRS